MAASCLALARMKAPWITAWVWSAGSRTRHRFISCWLVPARNGTPAADPAASPAAGGGAAHAEALYTARCKSCHEPPVARAPGRARAGAGDDADQKDESRDSEAEPEDGRHCGANPTESGGAGGDTKGDFEKFPTFH